MPTYKTPGVFIEEIPRLAPTVTAVATAVPAFIGFTEHAMDETGNDLTNLPTRITSLADYQEYFGSAPAQVFDVGVTQYLLQSSGKITDTKVEFTTVPPRIPPYLLYYSMQLFFANGGGVCYIVSIGNTSTTAFDTALFVAAFHILENYDEPTLYVFPDACSHRTGFEARDADVAMIVDAALQSCARMKDRFTIADIHNAIPGGTTTNADVDKTFRNQISASEELRRYGAAYFPYLDTSLNFVSADTDVTIVSHTIISVAADGRETRVKGPLATHATLATAASDTGIQRAIKEFIRTRSRMTLPPSGAIAGVYAQIDANRGVWKAPANVAVAQVEKPAIWIDNNFGAELNVNSSGKSINAIRYMPGRSILIWGARTLAGNDNEWRYIAVRRFCNFIEESVTTAIKPYVFEPNDTNTWVKVCGMIETFLLAQRQQGALMGSKPEEAFFVRAGLNQTMTGHDVAEGRIIVEIGLAVARPAEFVVLRIVQKMQEA